MKTRIIQTRFWDDEVIVDLSIYGQHLYIYLLTCQYINICGIFQLSEAKIRFEAKFEKDTFETAKSELAEQKKAYFYKGWVFVVNALKNNNYTRSEDNKKAYNKELERVPKEVYDYFQSCISDTTVDTTVDSSVGVLPTVPINNKSKIINQKPETITQNIDDEIVEENDSPFSQEPPKPKRGIHTEWQEKAFRYAEYLKIELIGNLKPRWLKFFKSAYENENMKSVRIKIETSVSDLYDRPTFQALANEAKVLYFFKTVQGGER